MKKKRIRNLFIAGVVLLVLFLIIGKKQGWIGAKDRIKVSTEKVAKRDIIETVNANGKVRPEREVIITSDVSGEIIELYVKEGDKVQRGDSLLGINPEIYQSNVDRQEAALNTNKANLANARARLSQVKANFANAKANYQRNKKLFKQGVISRSEFDKSKSSYESAKAEVDAAKENVRAAKYSVKSAEASLQEARDNLRKTSVFAPMTGIISRLDKEMGERIAGASQFSAGTEVLRIADLENMEVKVDVSENNIILVELNDTAKIDVDAYPDQVFKGVVTEIANSANQNQQAGSDQVTNFEVKIKMLKSSYKTLLDSGKENNFPFRPGMTANVDIQTSRVEDAVSVPIQAVIAKEVSKEASIRDDTDYKKFVFLYKNDYALMKEVKTGIQDDRYIEIKSGVTQNDKVITAPYTAISEQLEDSTKVEKVDKSRLMLIEKE